MPLPSISVVIPAYNAGEHIRETLASALSQEGPFVLDTIVVDDGSSDDTRALAESVPGVRLIHQANAGPSAARNRGIAAARGELIAFLDADDLWLPGKLETQLGIMTRHPETGLVCGDCRLFSSDGEAAETMFEEYRLDTAFWGGEVLIDDPYAKLLRCNFIATSSVLVRKRYILAVGGFHESMRHVEDMDLWLRLALHCRFAYTSRLCERKRQHPGGVSNAQEAMALAYVAVLRRQRARNPQALRSRGIRLGPLIAAEYNVLGDRRERAGDPAGARRYYRAAFRAHPSLRALYYLARCRLGAGSTAHPDRTLSP